MNLFRAAVCLNRRTFCRSSALPPLYLRIGAALSSLQPLFCSLFQKRWRVFVLCEIYLKIVRRKHTTRSLAHLFYAWNSINIQNLRSPIPSGRTGQFLQFRLSRFVFRDFRILIASNQLELSKQSNSICVYFALFLLNKFWTLNILRCAITLT